MAANLLPAALGGVGRITGQLAAGFGHELWALTRRAPAHSKTSGLARNRCRLQQRGNLARVLRRFAGRGLAGFALVGWNTFLGCHLDGGLVLGGCGFLRVAVAIATGAGASVTAKPISDNFLSTRVR